MSKIATCPKCESLLLARVGVPSPIDGQQALRCLSCSCKLQPRRDRRLVYVMLVSILALGLFIFLHALGLAFRRGALGGVALWAILAISCVRIASSIRQTLQNPTPNVLPTSEFPNSRVRLVRLSLEGPATEETNPVWTGALREFVSLVIQAAGQTLPTEASQYKVEVRFDFRVGHRTELLTCLERPSVPTLNALTAELASIPPIPTHNLLTVELRFEVQG